MEKEKVSKLETIEHAVIRLSRDELSLFRNWFAEFDAVSWDEQFEEDVKAGKLDGLAARAIDDFRAGKCTEL